MKRRILSCAVLMLLVIAASLEKQKILGAAAAIPPLPASAGGVPTFEPDPNWPKVPGSGSWETPLASGSMRRITFGCCIARGLFRQLNWRWLLHR